MTQTLITHHIFRTILLYDESNPNQYPFGLRIYNMIRWSMIKINQKSYFEVQLKAVTNTSYNFSNINELVAVNLIWQIYKQTLHQKVF